MRTRAIGAVCFSVFLSSVVGAQGGDFLDLTKIKTRSTKKTGGEKGRQEVSMSLSERSRPSPVTITILKSDKRYYHFGDEIMFDVMLENITHGILTIPWSGDRYRAKPDDDHDPPGYVYAFLSLWIKDDSFGEHLVSGHGIYGSQLTARSLKKLLPGQRVRIRAPSLLHINSANVSERVLGKLPRKFEIKANLSLSDGTSPRYETAISPNSITIEVKRRQE